MKSESPLVTLRDLAQQDCDQAAKQLGVARQAYLKAEQQLSMLLSYQDEYRSQLNNNLTQGIDANRWQNYQQFIITLDKAIEQHRHQVSQCSQHVDHAVKYWQDKHQRLNAFETLQSRAETTLRQQQNRREQKMMDEFAQRSAQRNSRS